MCFLPTPPALHTGGGAEERTPPRTGRVLHSEDAGLQRAWNTSGGARLHGFLHRPLRRERSLTEPAIDAACSVICNVLLISLSESVAMSLLDESQAVTQISV